MTPSNANASRNWADLAALLDPVGRCTDPLVDGRDIDWVEIYRLATSHLVAPSLYSTLMARERLWAVPDEVRSALAELYRLNAAHNTRLRAVLRDTVRLLNAAGITPLLLKGAIALLPGQYPYASTRMLSDLDLALVNAEAEAGAVVLQAAGYWVASNIEPASYTAPFRHLAPLFHPSGDGYVELHRQLLSDPMSAAVLSLKRVSAAAVPVAWDGLHLRVPTLGHRLLHNALHAQVDNETFHTDRRELRQLLEFTQLCALPEAAGIDWPGLLAEPDRLGLGEVVRGWLLAVERLFGQPLPAEVSAGATTRAAEERFWRRLADPRLNRWLERRWRLVCIGKRLVTPAWYPAKMRYLYRQWLTVWDIG